MFLNAQDCGNEVSQSRKAISPQLHCAGKRLLFRKEANIRGLNRQLDASLAAPIERQKERVRNFHDIQSNGRYVALARYSEEVERK